MQVAKLEWEVKEKNDVIVKQARESAAKDLHIKAMSQTLGNIHLLAEPVS